MNLLDRVSFERRRVLTWIPATLAAGGLSSYHNLFASRADLAMNSPVISSETVTEESERAVRKALDWLRKTQNQDGGCGVDKGANSDIGCTAITGLAFLAHGSTPFEGYNKNQLRDMRRYILRLTDSMPQNDITNVTGTQIQNKIGQHAHSFFAALFLSQLVGEESNTDSTLLALKKVISAIVRSQLPTGDWGSTSWAPTLGTVMGWVSLRAAGLAGLSVGTAPDKTANHLVKKMRENLNANQGWMHNLYKNATGIRVLFEMGRDNEEIASKAFDDVLNLVSKDNTPFTQAGGEEFLAFHLITETMLQKGGNDWNKWFSVVRDKTVSVQNNDGSWTGHHCITSRTFCTAAAVLVLTSPYRYLPISQG